MMKPQPSGLQTRGSKLWDSVTAERDFDAAGYALLEDACRTSDLIDKLQGMLDQDEADWIALVEDALGKSERKKRLVVNVRPLLGEIRQQRLAMNRLMNQLGIAHLTSEADAESKQSESFWAAKEAEFKE